MGKNGKLGVMDYLRVLAYNWLRDDSVEVLGLPYCQSVPPGEFDLDCTVDLFDFASWKY